MAQKRHDKRRDLLLLLVVAAIALTAYFLTRDQLAGLFRGGLDEPTDEEENMIYSVENQISSAHALERSGIVLQNAGDRIRAVELASGIQLDVTDLGDRSQAPIQDFAEYVGYVYMFDGETVYRSQLDGSELRATIEDCLQFEPMGDYLYSLKLVDGAPYLHRCSIIGTYEKLLFSEPFLDFRAYDGDLLLQRADGSWWWYDVLTQESSDVALPEGARSLELDEEGILYLTDEGLYRKAYDTREESLLYAGSVAAYVVGPHHLGLLLSGPEGCQAAVCGPDGEDLVILEGETFSPESALDLSAEHLFVTDGEGTTHYTPLGAAQWGPLFK